MAKVRVLIVDDEFFVCQLISHLVEWEKYHAKIIGMIDNGEEALDVIMKECPDVIISDIRMPGLNGIELVKAVKNLKNPAKIILISGHRSFEYAREAINLGADYYLLKPIRKNELLEVFQGIVAEIEKERSLADKEKDYEEKLLSSKNELRKQFMSSLIGGQMEKELPAGLSALNEKYHFAFQKGCFLLGEWKLDLSGEGRRADMEILRRQLSKYQHELNSCCMEFELFAEENALWVLANYKKGQRGNVIWHLKSIRETLEEINRCPVTLVAGLEWEDLGKLAENMEEFKKCVYLRLDEQEKVILEKEDGGRDAECASLKLGTLIRYIEGRDNAAIVEYFEKLKEAMKEERGGAQLLKIHRIVSTFYQLFEEGRYEEEGRIIEETIENMNSIEEIWKYVTQKAGEVIAENEKRLGGINSVQIEETVRYINAHYSENLKLKDMAERVYISPQYLSGLFKKEMNMTISDYIAKIRMERAKELLKDTGLSIGEIAEKTGYKDIRHFSTMFKRLTGLTPSEFRRIGI